MAWTKEKIEEYIHKTSYELVKFENFDYINSLLILQCKKCGNIEKIKFNNFKRKKDKDYCKKCEFIKTRDELFDKCLAFSKIINYKVFNDLYYEDKKWYIKVQCYNNHEPYFTRVDHFLDKHLCKQCANEKLLVWNENRIKEYIIENGYELLDIEGEGWDSSILIWCKNKKHTPYKTTLSEFKKGHRCKQCYNDSMIKWDKEHIISYVEKNNVTFIDFVKYDNHRSIIKILCEKHGSYEIALKHFIEGQRCPTCNESKGERKIRNVLKKINIDFKHQYKFDDCKFYKTLPFDFYLPQYNCCIEYDGQQHYEIVNYFGGFDKFIDTKIRDTIKNIYCKENNIKLIRIPYWEFDNIEKIICQELNFK